MKKNFAKKLATVLSLTMVASLVVPAVPASAATAPDLAKRRTYVYEGNEYSYAATNAKGYTVKWSVSGEGAEFVDLSATKGTKTVLTVETKGDVAAKLAPVAVKAKFYKDGELKKTRTDNVNIKVSATGVAITETATVPAGEPVDFNRTLTPANATSKTYWSVTDKDGKPVDAAVAKIDAAGIFTASKVGDYKVVASVRNAKDSAEVAGDSQDIKAVLKLTDVKLTALSKVDLTFNDSVKGIQPSDIVITENKVRVPVKSVSLSADEKVVTAEIYDKFADAKTYSVTAKESTKDFTAAIGKIDSIELLDQTFKPLESKTIAFKVLDANKVDITANYTLGTDITVETTSNYVSSLGAVFFAKDGDFAKVVLKNTQYNSTTGAVSEIKSREAVISAGTPTVSAISTWVINSSASAADFDKDTKVITADQKSGKYLHVKATKGTDTVTTGFAFTSLNESVLVVDKATGQLFPQKDGSALVKVEIGSFVDYVTVTVGASRAVNTLTSDLTSSISLSNSLVTADSYTVTFTLKDQYNEAIGFTADKASVTTYDGKAVAFVGAVGDPTDASNGVYKVTFTALNGQTGSTSYKVTVDGKIVMVPVSVVTPGASTGYAANLTKTTVDPFKGETTALTAYVMSGNTKRDIITDGAYTYEVKNSKNETKVSSTQYVAGTVIPTATLADDVYTVYVKNGSAVVAITTLTVKTSKPAAVLETVKISTSVKTTILAAVEDAFDVKVNGTTQAITGVTFISLDTAQIAANATASTPVAITANTNIFVQDVTVAGYTVSVNKVITITK